MNFEVGCMENWGDCIGRGQQWSFIRFSRRSPLVAGGFISGSCALFGGEIWQRRGGPNVGSVAQVRASLRRSPRQAGGPTVRIPPAPGKTSPFSLKTHHRSSLHPILMSVFFSGSYSPRTSNKATHQQYRYYIQSFLKIKNPSHDFAILFQNPRINFLPFLKNGQPHISSLGWQPLWSNGQHWRHCWTASLRVIISQFLLHGSFVLPSTPHFLSSHSLRSGQVIPHTAMFISRPWIRRHPHNRVIITQWSKFALQL